MINQPSLKTHMSDSSSPSHRQVSGDTSATGGRRANPKAFRFAGWQEQGRGGAAQLPVAEGFGV